MLETRKRIALMIVCVFVFTVFAAGCGKEDSQSTSTAASAVTTAAGSTAAAAAGPFDKHLEISWIGHNQKGFNPPLTNDNQKLLEEKFNVTIKPVQMDYFSDDVWNLYWASGNTADFITLYVPGRFSNLASQGLIRDFSEAKMRELMPTWMKEMDSMVDAATLKAEMSYNGKTYVLPYIAYSSTFKRVAAVRQDWLDNVGITKLPATLDELTDLMKKFTFNDPDKNNKKDTYGTTTTPEAYQRFNFVFGSYGFQTDSWYAKDGKISYTGAIDEYKEALKFVNGWYKAGVIDPEFITDKREQQRNKWSEGKIGLLHEHPYNLMSTSTSGPNGMLLSKNPNAKISYISAVKGPAEVPVGTISFPDIRYTGMCFGKNASDEVVERIMRIKEEINKDPKLYDQMQSGVEGVQFSRDPNNPNVRLPIGDFGKPEKVNELGLGQYFGLTPRDKTDILGEIPEVDKPMFDVSASTPGSGWFGIGFAYSGVNEAFTNRGADVTKVFDEFYYKAVTGGVDIDAEWPNYLKRLEGAGLNEILSEYQTLYDAANK